MIGVRRRNTQLVRVLRLQRLLVSGRWRLQALADSAAVSTRTVRRDIAALEDAEVRVTSRRCDDGVVRWWVPREKS